MSLSSKPSLIQKIFLLVLVPIALETVFLAGLAELLQISEEQLVQEMRVNEVNITLDNMVTHLYSAGTDLAACIITDSQDLLKQYKRNTKLAAEGLQRIEELTARDKDEKATAQKLKDAFSKITGVLEEARSATASYSGGWRFMKTHKLNKQLQLLSGELFKEVDKLRELEHARQQRHPPRARELREMVKRLIWLGAAVNVCLAATFALIISRDMVARLKLLMENARRIGTKQQLLPVVHGRDEIHQLDRTLHLAAEELSDADKRQTETENLKNDFVSMIGHDLRTPLTTVQASLTQLKASADSSEDVQLSRQLTDAVTEVKRLVKLTEDLLDVSVYAYNSFTINPDQVDSWIVIEQAIRATSPLAAEKNIQFIRPEDEFKTFCDRNRIVQVLINLITNAITASPINTKITLSVSSSGSCIIFSVSDSGAGVPDDSKEIVFQKFMSLTSEERTKKPGLGLGLAVCKSIVSGHGGEIGVKDAPGGGACFWFTLPNENTALKS